MNPEVFRDSDMFDQAFSKEGFGSKKTTMDGTRSVGTPLRPYGIAYRRAYWHV